MGTFKSVHTPSCILCYDILPFFKKRKKKLFLQLINGPGEETHWNILYLLAKSLWTFETWSIALPRMWVHIPAVLFLVAMGLTCVFSPSQSMQACVCVCGHVCSVMTWLASGCALFSLLLTLSYTLIPFLPATPSHWGHCWEFSFLQSHQESFISLPQSPTHRRLHTHIVEKKHVYRQTLDGSWNKTKQKTSVRVCGVHLRSWWYGRKITICEDVWYLVKAWQENSLSWFFFFFKLSHWLINKI